MSGLKTLGNIQGRANTRVLTADETLTIEQSGTIFFLDTPGEALIIPAASTAKGVWYKFIVNVDAVATSDWTITSAGTSDIHCVAMGGGGAEAAAGTAGTSVDVVTLTTSAKGGDWIYIVSDGTKWFATGQSIATAGLTEG